MIVLATRFWGQWGGSSESAHHAAGSAVATTFIHFERIHVFRSVHMQSSQNYRRMYVWKRDCRDPGSKKKPTSLQAEMQADFKRIRENESQQINAMKRYLVRDVYSPEDLNPYKRQQQFKQTRESMVQNLKHKGTLMSSLPQLRLTDVQVSFIHI